jgi:hypothetical protein
MQPSIALAILFATGAAMSAAHASNLVENPDFDNGLDGWPLATVTGTVELDATTGLPSAPSLHLLGDQVSAVVAAQSSCIEIDDSANVDLRAFVKPAGGIVAAGVQAYSDNACMTALDVVSSPGLNANDTWGTIGFSDMPLPDGTASVRVTLSASITEFSAGDALFDHVEFGPTGTLPEDGIALAQEGLTGAWYNPQTSGQGFEFVVDTSATPNGNAGLFGAWYTFDVSPPGGPETQRWYSIQGSFPLGATSTEVTIYRNTGGNFDAPPTTAAEPVGTGTLTFFSCSSGFFTYAIDNGPIGSIPLIGLLPNVECDESGNPINPPSDFGFSGSWYEPATSGQGFLITINPVDAQAFVGWYTYAMNGENAGAAGQRWFSAQGGYTVGTKTMELTVYASTGGVFDSGDPVTTDPVGTATLTFANCTAATFEYAITDGELAGQSGTIDLTRLGAPLESCQTITN